MPSKEKVVFCFTEFNSLEPRAESSVVQNNSKAGQAALAFGIYEFMQSAAGRGPGAALGMIAVLMVGLGTYFSYRIIERGNNLRAPST